MFRNVLLVLALSIQMLVVMSDACLTHHTTRGMSQCLGTVQCCEGETFSKDSEGAYALMQVLGISVDALSKKVLATGCSSSGIGILNGNTCKSSPMCCDDNSFGGLVGIGCNDIGSTSL
ncbi:hypothetical protein WOLCODRAFT_165744 [Wolfiporia cocos MD-104 SS10]|uniref:Hydrophobin n=1 Tax=Wolfiporia cocos (strain MD-104) TaxID=742152 RepID=A0A2H3J7I3_WOLCO|nr:hypothetical protein WOLCODRAFT_165744 [Wolfiporia cocos MD-104 SS10]